MLLPFVCGNSGSTAHITQCGGDSACPRWNVARNCRSNRRFASGSQSATLSRETETSDESRSKVPGTPLSADLQSMEDVMRLVVGITGATGAIYEDAGVQTDHLISVCARCDLARDRLHGAGGRGSPRHRSMNCLNIARVIVSPGPLHTPRADMVWHDVTVVSKRDGAKAVLCDRFSIKQLSHFSIR